MSFGTDAWAKWVINEEEVRGPISHPYDGGLIFEQALPLLKAAWERGVTYVNVIRSGYSDALTPHT
jgi:hypothetical protein